MVHDRIGSVEFLIRFGPFAPKQKGRKDKAHGRGGEVLPSDSPKISQVGEGGGGGGSQCSYTVSGYSPLSPFLAS